MHSQNLQGSGYTLYSIIPHTIPVNYFEQQHQTSISLMSVHLSIRHTHTLETKGKCIPFRNPLRESPRERAIATATTITPAAVITTAKMKTITKATTETRGEKVTAITKVTNFTWNRNSKM